MATGRIVRFFICLPCSVVTAYFLKNCMPAVVITWSNSALCLPCLDVCDMFCLWEVKERQAVLCNVICISTTLSHMMQQVQLGDSDAVGKYTQRDTSSKWDKSSRRISLYPRAVFLLLFVCMPPLFSFTHPPSLIFQIPFLWSLTCDHVSGQWVSGELRLR